jgi:hypothetical protein
MVWLMRFVAAGPLRWAAAAAEERPEESTLITRGVHVEISSHPVGHDSSQIDRWDEKKTTWI